MLQEPREVELETDEQIRRVLLGRTRFFLSIVNISVLIIVETMMIATNFLGILFLSKIERFWPHAGMVPYVLILCFRMTKR